MIEDNKQNELSNDLIIKKKIKEKDDVNLKYKQKLNSIKQHYGVEFDVEHFKNDEVKNIIFLNLKYKNLYTNVTISYNNSTNEFDYIDYEFSRTLTVKNTNHKKLASNIEKDYKLRLIVGEINRANTEYINELKNIDKKFSDAPDNAYIDEKDAILEKNKKNE